MSTNTFFEIHWTRLLLKTSILTLCIQQYAWNNQNCENLGSIGHRILPLTLSPKLCYFSVSRLSQCFILYNWHTDPCHLIGGTYFTWHSLLVPSTPAIKKTYSPMGNSISHSTVQIFLVPNVFEQYNAAAPLVKHRSTCAKGCDQICALLPLRGAIFGNTSNNKDLYVSYIQQVLSGFNSWIGRNIIARYNLDCSISLGFASWNGTVQILPCDNIPPIPLWATQYLYTLPLHC